ncbi:MAG: SDR family oxidoreductase [Halobacteriota archaeon]
MKSKIVLVTGSSVGIGRETAHQFAQENATVVVTYYKEKEEAEKTYKTCLELGAADASLVTLDLMDDNSIFHAVDEVVKEHKKIDILVNNAGTLSWTPLQNQSFRDIATQVRTNLEGLIKMTRACLPHVKNTIINIGSIAGTVGMEELTVLCATKFGVRGFTQALAKEVPHINVYTVNPDFIATRMTNFQGRPPEEVARVVVNVAKGIYELPSGSDIDVWKVVV